MKEVEAFRVLASADRQLLLQELLERNGEAPLRELSKKIAVRRHRISPDSIDDSKVKRAQIRLVHEHLPLLEDYNIIDFRDEKVALTNEECINQLFGSAEELGSWPPDDLLKQPPL